jgi:hypothetical protein
MSTTQQKWILATPEMSGLPTMALHFAISSQHRDIVKVSPINDASFVEGFANAIITYDTKAEAEKHQDDLCRAAAFHEVRESNAPYHLKQLSKLKVQLVAAPELV